MPRRRRDPPPDAASWLVRLDLHGHRADEARERATRWLGEQAARGEGVVEVITGRGTRSPAGPVLRGEIEPLLHALSGGVVERWEPAAGGGALRVYLRPPAPPPARQSEAATWARLERAHPAALRRRALDSLAELGITATPTLLAAEIARLLAQE